MYTPEQAVSIVSDQVTSLHASLDALISLIKSMQDDLINQYDASHSEPFNGFGDEYTDEACCIGDLDCVKSDLADASDCLTRAMELLGLV